MNSWNSIVVGIDFSEASAAALREAARMAHWNQCSLHLAHVIAMERDYESPSDSSTAVSIARDHTEKKLKKFCLEHIEFLDDFHYHILVGHPFHEICQLTRDIASDLLVLGACGQRDHGRRIGAIASKCMRKAPVPVLLIRTTHENPFRTILAAIDFSPTSLKATELAAEIAFENQSHLHLIHVHEPSLKISDSPLCPPEGEESAVSMRALAELQSKLKEVQEKLNANYPDLTIKVHLLQKSKVSVALTNFIETKQVNLAILGTRGRTGLRSLLMGTTAERLIHDCPCSILAVKSDNFTYPFQ